MLPLWIALPYLFGRWAKGEIKKQQAKEYVRQHPPESPRAEMKRKQQLELNRWCNFQASKGFPLTLFWQDINGDWHLPKETPEQVGVPRKED